MTDLFILSGTFSGGGAERIAATLGNDLPDSISRKLVALHASKSVYVLKYDVLTLSHSSSNSAIRRIGKFPILLVKYIRLLHQMQPKVSLSILLEDNLLNVLASYFSKTKPIVSFHWTPDRSMSRGMRSMQALLIRIIQKKQIHVVAVSHGVKDVLISLGVPVANIEVIYNPIDVEAIAKLATEDVPEGVFYPEVPTLITVGRLNKVKAQWHLIRVFAELRKEMSCRLLICGVGPEGAYLKRLAVDLGVAKDIVFLGWQDNPYKYMARSDVFVLTSVSESFGNVLVEAMACGCPVVAANCSGGIGEILGCNGEYGLISEKLSGVRHPCSEKLDAGELNLLKNIELVLEDAVLRKKMSLARKERAEYFSKEKQLAEYEHLIRSLL